MICRQVQLKTPMIRVLLPAAWKRRTVGKSVSPLIYRRTSGQGGGGSGGVAGLRLLSGDSQAVSERQASNGSSPSPPVRSSNARTPGRRRRRRSRDTVRSDTAKPNLPNSPWMRGASQRGLPRSFGRPAFELPPWCSSGLDVFRSSVESNSAAAIGDANARPCRAARRPRPSANPAPRWRAGPKTVDSPCGGAGA
jgi:hypothetical protein